MIANGEDRARIPRLASALLRTQPDERLAELAGEGSDGAFEEMVRRHRGKLVAFAGTIAPPGYADDVVQDSMLKARAALRRGDRPEYTKAWLFKIVRNTALNERRGHREHDEIDETIDGVEQPPQAFERRAEIRNLVVALSDLPEAQRRAIVQRELEGRGHEEIAADLDVSPGAVRQLIHRARTTLRTGLGALIPIQLLRLAVLGGGSEQALGGTAATGLGLTGAKVGFGALLATGAIVGGAAVGEKAAHDGGKSGAGTEAAASSAALGDGGAAASATPKTIYLEEGSVNANVKADTVVVKPALDGATPRNQQPPHPQQGQNPPQQGGGGAQLEQKPPQQNGGGGPQAPAGGQQGGGQHAAGGQKQPPPPPPPSN